MFHAPALSSWKSSILNEEETRLWSQYVNGYGEFSRRTSTPVRPRVCDMHVRIIQMSLPRFPECGSIRVCKHIYTSRVCECWCYIVDIRQAFIWPAARYCYTKPPTSEFLLLTGSPQIINGEFEHAHVFQRDSSSNSISIIRIVFARGRFAALNRYLNCSGELVWKK